MPKNYPTTLVIVFADTLCKPTCVHAIANYFLLGIAFKSSVNGSDRPFTGVEKD